MHRICYHSHFLWDYLVMWLNRKSRCSHQTCQLFYRNGWSRRRDQESEKHGLVEVVRLHSYSADSERHHRKRLQRNIIVLVLKYALDL